GGREFDQSLQEPAAGRIGAGGAKEPLPFFVGFQLVAQVEQVDRPQIPAVFGPRFRVDRDGGSLLAFVAVAPRVPNRVRRAAPGDIGVPRQFSRRKQTVNICAKLHRPFFLQSINTTSACGRVVSAGSFSGGKVV